jgi:hypothetical protein
MARHEATPPETELHKLIRYGSLFELEKNQMQERRDLLLENHKMKEKIKQQKYREGRKKRDARRKKGSSG